METQPTKVTVETTVNVPVEKAWEIWNEPTHVTKWASPSPDWHTTSSENDLRTGGSFKSRMEAKDGSYGFDFGGVYDQVDTNKYIEYTMGDNRNVTITFTEQGGATHISETFDAETIHPVDFQKAGWQAIMDNYKKYAEANALESH